MINDNEIVLARLSGGPSIVMSIGPNDPHIVKVLIRRNRQAKLPSSRIILRTGIFVDDFLGILKFREETREIIPAIDIRGLWESVKGRNDALSIQELASIYWRDRFSPQESAALAMVIESKESTYFDIVVNGYSPREDSKVQELEKKIRAAKQRTVEEFQLSKILKGSEESSELTVFQKQLLSYVRGFVIGGDSSPHGSTARDFMQNYKFPGDLRRTGFDLLIKLGEFKLDDPIELERENIPIKFPREVLEEVHSLDLSSLINDPKRKDLRDLEAFTIDNVYTIDRDDAISVKVLSDDQNGLPNEIQIGIHIADASDAIVFGGLIDSEANKRMSSIYMPGKTVWMVPELLISNFSGLNPGFDRPAMSILVDFSNSGEILNWEVVRSLVNTKVAMSYQEADSFLKNEEGKWKKQISIINLLAKKLRTKRNKNGALDLSRREMEIKFSESGVVDVSISQELSSRGDIAEFMILYNHLMAQYCHNFNIPTIFRSQMAPTNFNGFDDYGDGPFKNYLIFKQLEPVIAVNELSNHWGLGVNGYVQVTSPLRRYTDLVMQRQIANHMKYSAPIYSLDSLNLISMRSVEQLRGISRLESERVKFWFSKFLIQKRDVGEKVFSAVVLENRPGRNALLELQDYPFKTRTSLNSSILPGDCVSLEVGEVDWLLRQPKFSVCS